MLTSEVDDLTEVMTEPTEEPDHHGTTEPVFTEARDDTCLTETFEKTVNVSQDGRLTEETNRLQDGQRDRQAVSPKSKWVVGSQCLAVWSEDGQVYPATVLSVDGEHCRVCFHDYGNEEEVELSSLRHSDTATQRQNSQDWKPGSRCRAVYSEDGLVYPAVVLLVKGQRCRIRFDNYNNEEEQEVSNLLNPDELHGPSRTSTARGWRSGVRRREENQEGRGGEGRGGGGAERRSAWRDKEQNSSSVVKQSLSQTNVDREEKKREAEKPTNHSFPFFPPFPPPPPPQSSSADPVTFIPPPPPPPPPPPLWTFGGKESGVDSASSMLLLWYTCGFHTGCYMAQQNFRSSSKD